jgi:hypothetical protein
VLLNPDRFDERPKRRGRKDSSIQVRLPVAPALAARRVGPEKLLQIVVQELPRVGRVGGPGIAEPSFDTKVEMPVRVDDRAGLRTGSGEEPEELIGMLAASARVDHHPALGSAKEHAVSVGTAVSLSCPGTRTTPGAISALARRNTASVSIISMSPRSQIRKDRGRVPSRAR